MMASHCIAAFTWSTPMRNPVPSMYILRENYTLDRLSCTLGRTCQPKVVCCKVARRGLPLVFASILYPISLRLINVHLTRLTLSITDVLSTAEYPTKDFFES